VWSKGGGGEVSTLDGCSLFFRRDLGVRFDVETFDSWHLCVEDFCLQAAALGHRITVPPVQAEHRSDTGFAPAWQAAYAGYAGKFARKWATVPHRTTGSPATETVQTAASVRTCNVRIAAPGDVHSGAFAEIHDTLQAALYELGTAARSIYLGAHHVQTIPEDAIVYNFEQAGTVGQSYAAIMRARETWDYDARNVAALRARSILAKHVPLGYHPVLKRIQPAPVEDIDVLFYGSINPRRQKVIDELRAAGVVVVHLFSKYGAERDAYIARAKIVLNLHYYDSQIFEIPRVSYLLANERFVVSEDGHGDDPVYEEFADGVAMAPYGSLVETCCAFLLDPVARRDVARLGTLVMRERDEVAILRSALGIAHA
jgi:hypothetical protein